MQADRKLPKAQSGRFLQHCQALPKGGVLGVIQPVGKMRLRKASVAGKATNPVAMQEGVEMFGGVTCAQMIEIGVLYPIMGRLFHL